MRKKNIRITKNSKSRSSIRNKRKSKNVKHEKYEPKHNYRISIASNESEDKDEEEDR